MNAVCINGGVMSHGYSNFYFFFKREEKKKNYVLCLNNKRLVYSVPTYAFDLLFAHTQVQTNPM